MQWDKTPLTILLMASLSVRYRTGWRRLEKAVSWYKHAHWRAGSGRGPCVLLCRWPYPFGVTMMVGYFCAKDGAEAGRLGYPGN